MDPDWRCISYWIWVYSIAMLVIQTVLGLGISEASCQYHQAKTKVFGHPGLVISRRSFATVRVFFVLGIFNVVTWTFFFPANKQLRERWKAVRLWRVLRSKVHNSKNQNRQVPWYCWCTKSCTTKDDDYLTIHRVLTIPGGAGFRPWTVVPPLRSIKWVKTPPFLW